MQTQDVANPLCVDWKSQFSAGTAESLNIKKRLLCRDVITDCKNSGRLLQGNDAM